MARLKVLARFHHRSRTASVDIFSVLSSRLSFAFVSLVAICFLVSSTASGVVAEPAADGQARITFQSPLPNSVWQVGNIAEIILRMSGDTAFLWSSPDKLDMNLVSRKASLNISIPIEQHLDNHKDYATRLYRWPIPSCLSAGEYNLTLYDRTRFSSRDEALAVPILVQNDAQSDSCDSHQGANALYVQPGPFPLTRHIANRAESNKSTSYAYGTSTGGITVTAAPSGVTSAITVVPTSLPATIVVEPPGSSYPGSSTPISSGFTTMSRNGTVTTMVNGSSEVITVTATKTAVESITVVSTSLETIISTTTAPGTTIEFTSTKTMVTTMAVGMTQTSPTGGFLPVNSASLRLLVFSLTFWWTFCVSVSFVLILGHCVFI
ncbi:hypothetical protein AcV5_004401 [Taiwanofungus camphoratus]|nr:hypothetical protein AcV5_004401 [Antrodia cinnamomea]KAI0961416.1 hypothetical protein AcV7_000523 [Antrodia cinnamomea]